MTAYTCLHEAKNCERQGYYVCSSHPHGMLSNFCARLVFSLLYLNQQFNGLSGISIVGGKDIALLVKKCKASRNACKMT